MWISGLNGRSCHFTKLSIFVTTYVPHDLTFKSGCQRKPGKTLKMSTEGGQQNKFILTSLIDLVE